MISPADFVAVADAEVDTALVLARTFVAGVNTAVTVAVLSWQTSCHCRHPSLICTTTRPTVIWLQRVGNIAWRQPNSCVTHSIFPAVDTVSIGIIVCGVFVRAELTLVVIRVSVLAGWIHLQRTCIHLVLRWHLRSIHLIRIRIRILCTYR